MSWCRTSATCVGNIGGREMGTRRVIGGPRISGVHEHWPSRTLPNGSPGAEANMSRTRISRRFATDALGVATGAMLLVLLPAMPAAARGSSSGSTTTARAGSPSPERRRLYLAGGDQSACVRHVSIPAADIYLVKILLPTETSSRTRAGRPTPCSRCRRPDRGRADRRHARPGGTLGAGKYSVVYDECQDGKFNPNVDALFESR